MDIIILGIVSIAFGFILNVSPLDKVLKMGLGLAIFISLITLGLLSLKNFDSGPVPNLEPGDLLTEIEVFAVVFIAFMSGRLFRKLFKKL